MQENVLSIENLITSYRTDGHRDRAVALAGVSLDVRRGEVVGLVGESGCGKSATALSVMGLLPENGRVESGRAMFLGRDLLTLPDAGLRKLRGDRISMIFQEPMSALNPVMTIGRQVDEVFMRHAGMGRSEARRHTIEMLEKVDVPDAGRTCRAFPHSLSGGMRQRVMIAMAMAMAPDLLIADEPTTALDVSIEAQILRLMSSFRREKGTSILMITHNLGVIAEVCDRVYVMYAGEVVEHADVFTLFDSCAHPYTRALMDALPRKKPKGQRLYTIPGAVPDLHHMPGGCRFAPRCAYADERCRTERPPLIEIAEGHTCRCHKPCLPGGDRNV